LALIAALLCTSLGAALAFSRGVIVGLVATFGLMLLMGIVKLRHVFMGLMVGVVVLVAIPEYGARFSSLTSLLPGAGAAAGNVDSATSGRITEMKAALLMYAEHPVIGLGPAMSRRHYREYAEIVGGRVRPTERYAHSLYLGIAAEYGSLGLIAFFGMMTAAFIELQRVRKRWATERPDRASIASGLMMMLVVYLTTGVFLHASYARYFWIVLGLAGAAAQVLGSLPTRSSERSHYRVVLETGSA
jgi:O-antigen ligase